MTDDHIRGLLARQPRTETLPHPSGTVAILHRHVHDASPDHAAVERWIAAHRGQSRMAPAAKAAVQSIGDGNPRWDGPFAYYVIPLAALSAAPSAPARVQVARDPLEGRVPASGGATKRSDRD